MAKVQRSGKSSGDGQESGVISRAVSGAVDAVSGIARAITGGFRALVGKSSGSMRAVGREMSEIYRLAPDMIRATRWSLAPDEVDDVVALMVDNELREKSKWSFARDPERRPGIVHYAILDYLKQKTRDRAAQDGAHDEFVAKQNLNPSWTSPASELEYAETHAAIQRLLHHMPEMQRAIFMAIVFGGLSYKEAAARTGTSVKNIEKHVHKAFVMLRSHEADILDGRVPVLVKKTGGRKPIVRVRQ